MTEGQGANTDRTTWVVLGLLAASCCLLASFVAVELAVRPGQEVVWITGAIWLFATIPHGMLGWAVWRGRRDSEIEKAVLTCAVVALLISQALFAGSLVYPGFGPLICIASPFWFTGWASGLQLLVQAHRLPRPPSPEE